MPPLIDPTFPFASSGRQKDDDAGLAAFHAWKKAPTPQTTSALLTQVSPIIDTAMVNYGGGSPTLRSRAKLMSLQAMKTFDPTKGSMKTHLLSQLRGLQRVAGGETQAIAVPERIVLQRMAVANAEKELEDRLGRLPSTTEVGQHLGLSAKRIAVLRRAHNPVNTGAIARDDEDSADPASVLPGDTAAADAWRTFVHKTLDPTNQLILEHSAGMFGRRPLSTGELADKLGISAGAVSQRKAKIQELLDRGGNFGF